MRVCFDIIHLRTGMELYLGSGIQCWLQSQQQIIKSCEDLMRAFAIIRESPIPHEDYTLTFEEPVNVNLVLEALKPVPPQRNNNVHVIDLRRSGRNSGKNSGNNSVVLSSQNINKKQLEQGNSIKAQQEEIKQVQPQIKLKAYKKKPIFEKTTAHREVRHDEETISSISSVRINSSHQDLEDDPQIFFNASHRKMKGEQKPYAPTYRTKAHEEALKQKQLEQTARKSFKPVRRKLFQSPLTDRLDSVDLQNSNFEQSQQLSGSKNAFRKKKPIFDHSPEKQTPKQKIILQDPIQDPHIPSELSSPKKQQSELAKSQSSKIIKLKPKNSRKSLDQSQAGSQNTEQSISISMISRNPMEPFLI